MSLDDSGSEATGRYPLALTASLDHALTLNDLFYVTLNRDADWLARSGRPHYRGFVSYYVAKAGIVALTEALALELARDQILVNAIAPGPIVPPPDLAQAEIDEALVAVEAALRAAKKVTPGS